MTDFTQENALLARLDFYAHTRDDRPMLRVLGGQMVAAANRADDVAAYMIFLGAPADHRVIAVPLFVAEVPPNDEEAVNKIADFVTVINDDLRRQAMTAAVLKVHTESDRQPVSAVVIVSCWDAGGEYVGITYYSVGTKGHLCMLYKGKDEAEARNAARKFFEENS